MHSVEIKADTMAASREIIARIHERHVNPLSIIKDPPEWDVAPRLVKVRSHGDHIALFWSDGFFSLLQAQDQATCSDYRDLFIGPSTFIGRLYLDHDEIHTLAMLRLISANEAVTMRQELDRSIMIRNEERDRREYLRLKRIYDE